MEEGFVTIQTLMTWTGLVGTVFGIVAFVKSQWPKALSDQALRWWAFGVGFVLQLFVAAYNQLFVAPALSLVNVGILVFSILTAVFIVIGTAGMQKTNKDNPTTAAKTNLPVNPVGASGSMSDTQKAIEAQQATTSGGK